MNNTTYYILTVTAPWGSHSLMTRCQACAEAVRFVADLIGFETKLTVPRYGIVWPWK